MNIKQAMAHKLIDFLILNNAELEFCISTGTVKLCIMKLLDDKDITNELNQLYTEIASEFTDENKTFRDIAEIINFYNKELTRIKNDDIIEKLRNMLEDNPLYFTGRICSDYDSDNIIPNNCGLMQKEYENLLKLAELIKQFIDNNYGEQG